MLYRKIHLKGFSFVKHEKAYEQLYALDNNQIYGDSFTLKETSIEDIGNNVSIVFEEMNFGEKGFSKLVLCGHSPLDKNTIQIHFRNALEDLVQLIEFTHSKDYVEKEFMLIPVAGLQTVTFVFLPGCQFDFKWFRFE